MANPYAVHTLAFRSNFYRLGSCRYNFQCFLYALWAGAWGPSARLNLSRSWITLNAGGIGVTFGRSTNSSAKDKNDLVHKIESLNATKYPPWLHHVKIYRIPLNGYLIFPKNIVSQQVWILLEDSFCGGLFLGEGLLKWPLSNSTRWSPPTWSKWLFCDNIISVIFWTVHWLNYQRALQTTN